MVSVGAGDFGILWYQPEAFSNFISKVQFRIFDSQANSGIFVRMRDPRKPLPEPIKSRAQKDLDAFNNLAWTAVHSGFEVQIDDTARPDSRVDFTDNLSRRVLIKTARVQYTKFLRVT
jgi:Domain of Unknown Function (DUF1080)